MKLPHTIGKECLRPVREENRLCCKYCGNGCAAVTDEAQSGIAVLGSGGHDEEVRGWCAADASGEDLEA